MSTHAPTLDQFESPSMQKTPQENYVFGGGWFTPKPPAAAAPAPVIAPEAELEQPEQPLLLRLGKCIAAGGLVLATLELILYAVLAR